MQTVTAAFLNELHQPVFQVRCKLEVLDDSEVPVDGGVFHDTAYQADATNILIDGNVDLDVSRFARRTFVATLLNNFGEWSPMSDWSGLFYVDRRIRLSRGFVYANGVVELVPIGVFLIDHADVTVERNMSVVNLSGTDKSKLLAKDEFTTPTSWAAGTSVNTVITDIITGGDVLSYSLDPLTSRPTNAKTLNQVLKAEAKDHRADVLTKLTTSFGIDAYFDPTGLFVTHDISNPADQPVVYTYTG